MVRYIKVSFYKARNMVKVHKAGLMAIFIKENFCVAREKESVFTDGVMEKSTEDSGGLAKCMVSVELKNLMK
jgi:hypothetical protein